MECDSASWDMKFVLSRDTDWTCRYSTSYIEAQFWRDPERLAVTAPTFMALAADGNDDVV
jgi:hypothetical protein